MTQSRPAPVIDGKIATHLADVLDEYVGYQRVNDLIHKVDDLVSAIRIGLMDLRFAKAAGAKRIICSQRAEGCKERQLQRVDPASLRLIAAGFTSPVAPGAPHLLSGPPSQPLPRDAPSILRTYQPNTGPHRAP
jgi:hypothetical protein